jgi:dipeptidyl aminopeptidase/acylaminoacyl peptidase
VRVLTAAALVAQAGVLAPALWEAAAALVAQGAFALQSAFAATPLEVYGRLPSVENVALSPRAERIAVVRTRGNERVLAVHDLRGAQLLYGGRIGEAKLRDLTWADEDHLLLTTSMTSLPPFGVSGPLREWWQLTDLSVTRRKVRGITLDVFGEQTFSAIFSEPMVRTVHGRTMLLVEGSYLAGNRFLPGLFRYDFESGRTSLVSKSVEADTDWLVDEAGEVAAELRYEDSSRKWTLLARREGKLSAVASDRSALDPPSLLGFDARGESILLAFAGEDGTVWKPWNLKEGGWGPRIHPQHVFRNLQVDDRTGRIVGGTRAVDDDHYYFFDNELQAHWDAMLRSLAPGSHVDLISSSADYAYLVIRIFGPAEGYRYALFDWYHHQLTALGPVYEGLEQVAEVRKVTYKAGDGRAIPAYVTLPPGTVAGAKGLPLVVLPHGGPAVADQRSFDWWAQALANAGYVVLQPNYRGSTVDRDLLAAGYGEWGRKMQTDLSDGLRYLVGEGLVDPQRVCIVGASYGGYAALAGMTLQPGVYRCGVSVAGIGDVRDMMRWNAERAGSRDNYVQRYWDRFMGLTGIDDPKLREISPIEHVGAVQGPLLLVHGKDDTVVPYRQSELIEKALRKAGKPVTFVTLKHEDHWLSRSETRLQMLEAVVAFLQEMNPAQAPSVAR